MEDIIVSLERSQNLCFESLSLLLLKKQSDTTTTSNEIIALEVTGVGY